MLFTTQLYLLASDDLRPGIVRVSVKIPIALVGNTPDAMVHLYWILWPVALHLKDASSLRFTCCDCGWCIIPEDKTED